ncbi:UDP-4-amino-4,6-dideoxy-N-acetyl-beta-L-altrosamine transaminase [Bdellovibrio reynosensis]|uniref:UDP-4-amino-4, 6-dideoxy-N-acetyl-beta-L-altrosamine transaminase n=1 Tax=Bdellovibrio reynosensis TaxID=2835041 RepID=A0ABY4CBA4_9BACT|nr:UDP-4-amino-4,6-dideoxy-N-acetyl-beta-L-altrosamine transaminase [Bdellovibrio reynosensis]UOF02257.1 UDP-4-amino-4,6-dideoxy-N-acetyl-beta-L-altrosamine transaminase [Bdellovibrio reynosensis]
MSKHLIPYGRQTILQEDIDAVVQVLKSDFLTQGPMVETFEKKFSEFIGCENSIAVSNGTAALHLAAMALGVKEGSKVLCTANSFVASANCIRYCGGDVEFVDINPENFCIDYNLLKAKLEKAPIGTYQGIVAVDFAGFPVDFEKLRLLADQYGLWIIEDACHALGAEFLDSKGQWNISGNGKYADIAVFSFHPVKHLATGEGGMITTNSAELNDKLRTLRTHGITRDKTRFTREDGAWYYEMQELGFNYRISDILCALGVSQLQRMPQNLLKRRQIAVKYREAFKNLPIKMQYEDKNLKNAYHLFTIQTEKRAELYDFLKSKGVYCQVHYIPIHTMPYYQNLYGKMVLENVEYYYACALSLPMYHGLSDSDLEYTIAAVKEFYGS